MARLKRKWQSGSADLVSVAVGMVILSIAAAGTSSAMIYGREVLGRQERYKAAAYMLKREMEKKIWEIESFEAARPRINVRRVPLYETELVSTTERLSGNQPVMISFWIEEITPVYDPDDPGFISFWIVSIGASWREPEMAGSRDDSGRQLKQIKYTTAVYNNS